MKRITTISLAIAASVACISSASAQQIPTNLSPTLKVGETVVIKGVRGSVCGQPAGPLAGLPKSSLGRFSGGREGTVNSRACAGMTPARELRFTATKAGSETVSAYSDTVTITVR
jgi:hypothetical protein